MPWPQGGPGRLAVSPGPPMTALQLQPALPAATVLRPLEPRGGPTLQGAGQGCQRGAGSTGAPGARGGGDPHQGGHPGGSQGRAVP